MLDLRCKAGGLDDYCVVLRIKWVEKFIEDYLRIDLTKGMDVLDIGEKNETGVFLANKLELKYYYTEGDLDNVWEVSKKQKYSIVFCLEVIEHLMNPLYFLENLKKYINENTNILISYPHRKIDILWGLSHFNEYRNEAFKTLISKAGYRVTAHSEYNLMHEKGWRFYLTGFRPLLRLIVVLLGWSKQNFYLIKLNK